MSLLRDREIFFIWPNILPLANGTVPLWTKNHQKKNQTQHSDVELRKALLKTSEKV